MFESKATFQPIRKLIVDIIDKKFSVMEFDPTKEKTVGKIGDGSVS